MIYNIPAIGVVIKQKVRKKKRSFNAHLQYSQSKITELK